MSRPVTDWRTALPLLHALTRADAPTWVSTRTRKAALRALDYLVADIRRLVTRTGSQQAAAEVIGVDPARLSEWRKVGALGVTSSRRRRGSRLGRGVKHSPDNAVAHAGGIRRKSTGDRNR